MIKISVHDNRTTSSHILSGDIIKLDNAYFGGDRRTLTLYTDTGYRVSLYLSREDIVELLKTFSEEKKTVPG
jgi:hypothetical protein